MGEERVPVLGDEWDDEVCFSAPLAHDEVGT